MKIQISSEQLALKLCQQAEQFVQQQEWDMALHCYQQAIYLNPQSFKAYHQIAAVLVQLKRWEAAGTAYQKAIQLNPEFCWSYNGLGKVLVQLKRWQAAVKVYQKSIQLNPDFCWSYYHLANVYFNLEQWEQAAQSCEAAIQLDAKISQFYQVLGNAYLKLQHWQKAVITFQRLIELDRNNSTAYLKLPEALIQLERWQEATIIYRQGLCVDPEAFQNTQSLIQMGKVLSQVGDFPAAIACFQNAIKLQPNQPWLYVFLGDAFQKNQQRELAIETYQQGMKLDVTLPKLGIQLGDLYTKKGDFHSATQAYQTASYQNLITAHPEFAQNNVILKSDRLPDFLIIGAAKCGTTSLYHDLTQHPQVLPALKKEIDFWHDDLKQGLDWYLSHFPPLPKDGYYLTGEASPHYLDLQETAQRVFQFCPHLKLIVIVRNPVERLISHYYHWVRLNQESRSLDEVIKTELKNIDRTLQFPIQSQYWYQSVNYIARGVYVGFIQQWMAIFPPEQFLILQSETLATQPQITLKQVFAFLGLPDDPISQYTRLNRGEYPSISPALRQTLSQFYQPYNQQLSEFLGRELGWNKNQ